VAQEPRNIDASLRRQLHAACRAIEDYAGSSEDAEFAYALARDDDAVD